MDWTVGVLRASVASGRLRQQLSYARVNPHQPKDKNKVLFFGMTHPADRSRRWAAQTGIARARLCPTISRQGAGAARNSGICCCSSLVPTVRVGKSFAYGAVRELDHRFTVSSYV